MRILNPEINLLFTHNLNPELFSKNFLLYIPRHLTTWICLAVFVHDCNLLCQIIVVGFAGHCTILVFLASGTSSSLQFHDHLCLVLFCLCLLHFHSMLWSMFLLCCRRRCFHLLKKVIYEVIILMIQNILRVTDILFWTSDDISSGFQSCSG